MKLSGSDVKQASGSPHSTPSNGSYQVPSHIPESFVSTGVLSLKHFLFVLVY